MRKKLSFFWKIWADTLGIKADENNNRYSDLVAVTRTIIFLTYLLTNIAIVLGVIKHWNN